MAKGAHRKFAADDVVLTETPLQTIDSFLNKPLQFNLKFGGPQGGRSMVKTAVAMAHRAGIPHANCDIALTYLNDPSDDARPPYGFSLPRDLIVQRPTEHLFHCVSVLGDPDTARLLAYVEYFGLCRLVVQLSTTYEGPCAQATYAIDPATGNEVEIEIDLHMSDADLEEVLRGQQFAEEASVRAVNYAVPIALKRAQERTIATVSKRAATIAFEKLGLKENDQVPEDRYQEFLRYVAEAITPLALQLMSAPTGPQN